MSRDAFILVSVQNSKLVYLFDWIFVDKWVIYCHFNSNISKTMSRSVAKQILLDLVTKCGRLSCILISIKNWQAIFGHRHRYPKFLSGFISVNLSGECNTLFTGDRGSRLTAVCRTIVMENGFLALFYWVVAVFKKPRRRTRPCFKCHKGDTTFVSSSNWKRLCVNLMSGCAFGGSITSWENWSTTRPGGFF